MPPKKKKSGKKGKKGKKSGKSARSVADSTSGPINELSKEFFLIQIRDLENRIARYQKKCDELELTTKKHQENYDQMCTDKYEIVTFLKKQLDNRGDEIADLNERLVGLQQLKDAEKEKFETEIQQLKIEFQEMKDTLTSENLLLGGKLTVLEEFKVQREDLMAKTRNLEDQLAQQAQDHTEIIYGLERKQVIDKDRLKKDMVMRVNKVANEFRKVSNKQMAETTKRTIRENVSINAQLAKMSDKTLELIKENDEMKAKDKNQRQHIEMLETTEKEIAKKNHSNQKLIRMLTEKCKEQASRLMEYDDEIQVFDEVKVENDILKQQVEATRDELMSLSKENDLLTGDLDDKTEESKQCQRNMTKLEKILGEAARAIQISLTSSGASAWEEDSGKPDYTDMEKRDLMLEHLLVLLNSASALGVGFNPSNMGKQYKVEHRVRSASEIPGSRQGFLKGEVPLSPIGKGASVLPHYQLGDLGLVPRSRQTIPTSIDKMAGLSITTRLGGLRKVLTRSVAIQTVSAPKAMFYADQLLSKAPMTTQTDLIKEFRPDKPSLGPIQQRRLTPSKVH